MSETFSIIFRGDILPGHNLPDVKAKMAQLFKLNDAKLAAIFSGKPVALKKDCDAATAEKFKKVLNQAGAEVQVKSNALVPNNPAPEKPAAAPPPPPPPAESKPAQPAAAPSAFAAPAEDAKPAPSAFAPAEPAPASTPPPPPQAEVVEAAPPPMAPPTPVGDLSVAATGSDVLTEAERDAQRAAPVQVSTDHIKMESTKSTFGLPDDEPAPAANEGLPTMEVEAPEFDLFEAGADLLKDDEKKVEEEVILDLSAYDVAEVGSDMLNEAERAPLPTVEVQDLAADLAPAGSDMGEVKKAPPPPPPSTDHISLA